MPHADYAQEREAANRASTLVWEHWIKAHPHDNPYNAGPRKMLAFVRADLDALERRLSNDQPT